MKPAMRGALWLAGGAALAIAAAIVFPIAVGRVPWRVERALAKLVGFQVPRALQCEGTPQAQAALKTLIARVYPILKTDADFPAQIAVIQGDTVNAFAALGGTIYIFAGLLQDAESPEEVAGVLAHELEHVRRRHVLQGSLLQTLARLAIGGVEGADDSVLAVFLQVQFTRSQEAQADAGALKRLHQAHIDPRPLAHFFERIAEQQPALPDWIASHPAPEDRAARLRQAPPEPTQPILDAAQWQQLQSICDPIPSASP